jgi:hypothetical protein
MVGSQLPEGQRAVTAIMLTSQLVADAYRGTSILRVHLHKYIGL